jgi:hypothetical protein
VVHDAHDAALDKDWLQAETTSFIANCGTRASNCWRVVIFMQPCEIQSVWKPQEFRMSKLDTNELARFW